MGRRIFVGLVVVIFAVAGLGLLSGCAKKELRTDMPAPEVKKKKAGLSDAEMREQRLKEELARKRMMFLNEMVQFDFDKSDIRPDAAEVLKRKAGWLQENGGVNIIIEGHCDERGTDEYNLALGERRAISAKDFLASLGIADARLETISYGEERPLDPGQTDASWAKNRRAQFVIK